MEGGFKVSPLKLNAGLGQVESWNENAIKDRANKLAASAVKVWTAPSWPKQRYCNIIARRPEHLRKSKV